MGPKAAIISTIIFIGIAPAHAEDCKAIQDAAARLACFDKPSTTAKPKPSEDPAIATAKAAVRKILKDPSSARFIEAKKMPLGVCVQLNAKNGYGGYSGIILFAYSSATKQAGLIQVGDTSGSVLEAIDLHDKICGKS